MSTKPKPDELAKIDESISNATNAKNTTQDLLLVSAPLAQCEDMLLPAPVVISLAAKLILISNNNDFTLIEPRGGFRHIHWASFRAAFAEVSHALQDAFQFADKNMQQICIHSSGIPKEFNRAARIIKEAPANEVSEILTIPLSQIQSATTACLELTQTVDKKFEQVSNMTMELFQATVTKQKDTEEEIKKIEQVKKGIEIAEQFAKQREADNETNLKKLEEKVNQADNLFKDTFDKADSRFMTMAIIETVTQTAKSGLSTFGTCYTASKAGTTGAAVVHALPSFIQLGMQQLNQDLNKEGENDFVQLTHEDAKEAERVASKMSAFSKAEFMLELSNNLFAFLKEDDSISDDAIALQDYQNYKEQYSELKRSLSQPSKLSKNAKDALNLCGQGWRICQSLETLMKAPDKIDKKNVAKNIQELYHKCKEFSGKAKVYLNNGVTVSKIGATSKKRKAENNEGLLNAAINHSHYQVEMSLKYLKETQEAFDKAQEDRVQLLNEASERAQKIASMDMNEIDYKNVRECLHEGLEVLGYLRQQWKYLAKFFQNMSALIQMAMITSGKFDQYAKQQIKSSAQHKFLRDFAYEEAFKAVKLAVIVRQLSKTYGDISQKFLMPQVDALDMFFNARSEQDRNTANQLLQKRREDAQNGIKCIIDNGRKELKDAMKNRQSQLQAIKFSLESFMSIEEKEENKKCAEYASFAKVNEEDDHVAISNENDDNYTVDEL